jgi:hypothetical protein
MMCTALFSFGHVNISDELMPWRDDFHSNYTVNSSRWPTIGEAEVADREISGEGKVKVREERLGV